MYGKKMISNKITRTEHAGQFRERLSKNKRRLNADFKNGQQLRLYETGKKQDILYNTRWKRTNSRLNYVNKLNLLTHCEAAAAAAAAVAHNVSQGNKQQNTTHRVGKLHGAKSMLIARYYKYYWAQVSILMDIGLP